MDFMEWYAEQLKLKSEGKFPEKEWVIDYSCPVCGEHKQVSMPFDAVKHIMNYYGEGRVPPLYCLDSHKGPVNGEEKVLHGVGVELDKELRIMGIRTMYVMSRK